MDDYFPNLAGHPDATAIFAQELANAALTVVPIDPEGETRCGVAGETSLPGGFRLRVRRPWCYASAKITPPIPAAIAALIADEPFAHPVRHYSGAAQVLGAVARPHGHAGGLTGDAVKTYAGGVPVDCWHADSLRALRALIYALRTVIAREGLTAEEAVKVKLALDTSSIVAAFEEGAAFGGRLYELVREIVHDDSRADPTDPRVQALRAAHPL
ncbi:MAG: hypothetical protein JNK72_24645 [Myxococcales bacterium]|nr:hypothetical protein [Myxococcales bacterium]